MCCQSGSLLPLKEQMGSKGFKALLYKKILVSMPAQEHQNQAYLLHHRADMPPMVPPNFVLSYLGLAQTPTFTTCESYTWVAKLQVTAL